jgi:hypothetical protein
MIRRNAELALQNRYASVIGLQRRRPIPGQGLQPEQGAIPDLLERLEIDPPAGQVDSLPVGTSVPLQHGQLIDQGQASAVQPITLDSGPVVVERGHQLPAVCAHGLGRRRPESGVVARCVRC